MILQWHYTTGIRHALVHPLMHEGLRDLNHFIALIARGYKAISFLCSAIYKQQQRKCYCQHICEVAYFKGT
jgi:hypothetical protein